MLGTLRPDVGRPVLPIMSRGIPKMVRASHHSSANPAKSLDVARHPHHEIVRQEDSFFLSKGAGFPWALYHKP